MMIYLLFVLVFSFNSAEIIKHLKEISVKEELPINSFVTLLTDKIPNLDQSIEYDLVAPSPNDLDLFSIDHKHHSLIIKNRIDYEIICLEKKHCTISVSIAISNEDTIDVYTLPIRIININDNPLRFLVNRTVIEIEENDENWSKKSYSLPRAYDDDGDAISYSIYLQNWNKPEGLFQFDEEHFLLKPLKKFDREEQNIYLLRLVAHNHNDISTDIIILIKDLNDNSPICQHNQSVFLISNISTISIFPLNVTDLDEGDNGKLEYRLINRLTGFSIDRYNGQIQFDYRHWTRSNESILMINITDHGKPLRLSRKCLIEIKFTFLFEIDFQSNSSISNQTNISLEIFNLHSPIGKFRIYDKQENKICFDCLLHIHSSWKDLFALDYFTWELYLNMNSMVLMRILTDYRHSKETLSVNVQIDVINVKNPSMKSTKDYFFILQLNKWNLLIYSNIFFLKIYENRLLNEQISISNRHHRCLNNHSTDLLLIDPTETFELDRNFNLILKTHLNTQQQTLYHLTLQDKAKNSTNEINLCSVQLQIYIINRYSIAETYPYFSQSFVVLFSQNLSQFFLPSLPSHVKYQSSVPDLISINPFNGSIVIRSSALYSSYSYDFQIQAVDSRVLSLSSSLSIRIFFGVNQHSPRLLNNSTRQTMEVLPSKFLYQIQAVDPDILLDDQMKVFPPTIEYQIEPSMNAIEIERFTGRIFLKDFNTTKLNFTVIMTDFGQPNRLITRHTLSFDIKPKENLSISFLIITSLILLLIILLSILILLINCCCTTRQKPNWKNVSPTAPDTRLIDNEYVTSSLPRREPKIHPTDRRNLSLDQIHSRYSTSNLSIKADYQQHVSTTDINKYLERFEKIYHDSSSQQYFHQPIGSVV